MVVPPETALRSVLSVAFAHKAYGSFPLSQVLLEILLIPPAGVVLVVAIASYVYGSFP